MPQQPAADLVQAFKALGCRECRTTGRVRVHEADIRLCDACSDAVVEPEFAGFNIRRIYERDLAQFGWEPMYDQDLLRKIGAIHIRVHAGWMKRDFAPAWVKPIAQMWAELDPSHASLADGRPARRSVACIPTNLARPQMLKGLVRRCVHDPVLRHAALAIVYAYEQHRGIAPFADALPNLYRIYPK